MQIDAQRALSVHHCPIHRVLHLCIFRHLKVRGSLLPIAILSSSGTYHVRIILFIKPGRSIQNSLSMDDPWNRAIHCNDQ